MDNKRKILALMLGGCLTLTSCGYTAPNKKIKKINTSGGVGKEYYGSNYRQFQDYISNNNTVAADFAYVFVDLNDDGYDELFLYGTVNYEDWHTLVLSIDEQGVFQMCNDKLAEDMVFPLKNRNGEYRLAFSTKDGLELYDFYFNKNGTEMTLELEQIVSELDANEWEKPNIEIGYNFINGGN